MNAAPQVQAMLPNDKEAEQGVLGAVLHSNEALLQVSGVLEPESFFSPSHRDLFKGMQELAALRKPIDEITLAHHMRERQQLEQVGGIVYIAELGDMTPVTANVLAYAEIVHKQYALRRLIAACESLAQTGREGRMDYEALAIKGTELFDEILRGSPRLEAKHESQLVDAWVERASRREEDQVSVRTSTRLDGFLGRMSVSRPIVIAGRPGMGKTAISRQLCTFIARKSQLPALYLNLEMDEEELAERDMAAVSGLDGTRMRNPQMDLVDGDDWDKVLAAQQTLRSLSMWTFTPRAPLTVQRIEAICRYNIHHHGIRAIFIDQLSKIAVVGKMGDFERQSARMAGVTRLVKKLRVPIVLACQVNRQGANEPTLEDLKGTGQIEEDAHAVIFVHAPHPKTQEERDAWNQHRPVKIIIAKNGGGATGRFTVTYWPKITSFDL